VALPSFTIVTPCLNGAATLEQALDSVRDQDYAGEVEHVVVDGGSTDGTLEILARRQAADEAGPAAGAARLRYLSEADRGLSDAVNKGIRMARGEVIGWLNADDVYLPGALARVGEALAARPGSLWATGPCLIVGADGEEIRGAVTRYKNLFLRRYSYGLHLVQNFVSCPSTFVRRAGFDRIGLLDERFKYSMDYDLWLRLGRLQAPLVLDEPLAAFRMAEGSLSMTGFERQFAEHAQNAREHGDGHRVAVALNRVTSRLIVTIYRLLRRLRAVAPGRQANTMGRGNA
jgi:glycosyltransferase involved in cell wall biosynthesis